MAEAGSKRIKVYNLAKELNLSSETLIEFLKKKGFEAKTHMSIVDEQMISVVHAHFKKEQGRCRPASEENAGISINSEKRNS